MRMRGFEAEGWTPESWEESKYNRFCDAYLEMAHKANYRAAAPGTGLAISPLPQNRWVSVPDWSLRRSNTCTTSSRRKTSMSSNRVLELHN